MSYLRRIAIIGMAAMSLFVVGCQSDTVQNLPSSSEQPKVEEQVKNQENDKENDVLTEGQNKEGSSSKENSSSDESEKEQTQITLIDQMGREVTLPKKSERVVMTALPLPSIYALTGVPLDKVVGMHPGAKSAIENSIMGVMYPDLVNVPTGFVEGTDINVEELLKLNPDVVFYWGPYSNQTEQLASSGIPFIGVKTQGDGDALLTLSTWLELMGKVFDRESEVKEVVDYGQQTLDGISEKVAGLEDDKRVKSLFLFKHSDESIIVPGTGHYGNYWIQKMGGINVAKDIDVTAPVNMEQIYAWNPDVIFISSFTTTFPEDLYDNKVNGQDWSKVEAVKNKRVYKVPVGVYRWYPPSGDVPLMMKWMAQKQYPELFNDYDMKQEIKDYYNKFYQFDVSDEQIDIILNPSKDTADGTSAFGKQKN